MIINSVGQVIAGRGLPSVSPDITVREACHVLDRLDLGALVVLDGSGKVVGVFSERDVIRKCVCRSRRTDETLVREIMTPDPRVIDIGSSLAAALAMMHEGGFRHLPVLDGERPVGMLSIRDIATEYRLMHERFVDSRNGVT